MYAVKSLHLFFVSKNPIYVNQMLFKAMASCDRGKNCFFGKKINELTRNETHMYCIHKHE